VTDNPNDIFITTAKLKIAINRKTQAITYNDLSGKIILAEADENNKAMKDTTVCRYSNIQMYHVIYVACE
jgi:alpha-D-xyloside xylohydrolase